MTLHRASSSGGWQGSVVVPDMTRDDIHRMRLREQENARRILAEVRTHTHEPMFMSCQHALHGECRETCKHCQATCACPCGHNEKEPA